MKAFLITGCGSSSGEGIWWGRPEAFPLVLSPPHRKSCSRVSLKIKINFSRHGDLTPTAFMYRVLTCSSPKNGSCVIISLRSGTLSFSGRNSEKTPCMWSPKLLDFRLFNLSKSAMGFWFWDLMRGNPKKGYNTASCVGRSFAVGIGKVYPNRASFPRYLRSIQAEENPQGPTRATAPGTF